MVCRNIHLFWRLVKKKIQEDLLAVQATKLMSFKATLTCESLRSHTPAETHQYVCLHTHRYVLHPPLASKFPVGLV